ncbi:hypothetical protein SAMN05421504_101790 [Amycolatopsis xylanica]|uniref:Uncharacterized protein n=1 Tax=Amycolatopsis xylanica TaxID=589385 RepID=A0A1H2U5S5_9PSEU|nr:hypothetical protein [Amycolatopsis xylanica]SDW51410.1 hypothetical protein SAMN05421504_101790 [Amycolatopsis xylanica]
MSTAKFRLPGLSRADALELGEFVDRESVSFDHEPVPDGSFGDLGLVTGVVAVVALKGLIGYLVYRHRGKSFEQVIEIQHPDGRIERRTVKWRDTSSEPVDAALAKELGSATGIPWERLIGDPR